MKAATRASSKSVGRALMNERLLAKPATPLSAHWARAVGLRRRTLR